jgi:hypothetical protein
MGASAACGSRLVRAGLAVRGRSDCVAYQQPGVEIKNNVTDAHYDLKMQGTEQGNIAVRTAFNIDNPVEEHEKNYVRDLKFASGGNEDEFAQ